MTSSPAPFVLASVLTSYPLEYLLESVPILLEDPGMALPGDLAESIRERLTAENLPDLQSEYIGIFDSGRQANPIYETEYDRRRALAKGNELSDIAGFYKAFGFELDPSLDGMEMLDHVGIELEFYTLMLMKEIHLSESGDARGAGIVRDARANFLGAHLGRFVSAIGRRPGVAESPFYNRVFAWCAGLVEAECARLGVTPVPADWIESDAVAEGGLECGQLGGCGKPPAQA